MTLFVLLAATVSALSEETGAASARVTLSVYARVVPSWAVTTMEILVVLPDDRMTGWDAEPDATAVPSTVTVAWLSVTTGVIVTDEMLLSTEAL
ncbi:hypothetical protein HA45_12985 [Pantoea rodasii]|nr:hypothetical protein HA45_12985 [Pantoea rodasii]